MDRTRTRRPNHVLRALFALLATSGALVVVVGVVAFADVGPERGQEVSAGAPVEVAEEPVAERHLAVYADGDALRAQAEEDAAIAYVAQVAADDAAAEAAAAEQAAAEAHAEQAAGIEFAAALAEQEAAEQAAAPAPAPTQAPAPPAVHGDPFDALAQCESGRNPNAVNPAGPYYGAFQFHAGTWAAYAPDLPGLPTDYGYAQQKTVAQRLQAARGWSPWPSCARQLGLL